MTSATIKLFLPRGDAKSLRTAEISNWTGKAVAAPRTELDELLAREELDKAGVYILIGSDPLTNAPRAYIGEAEVIRDRLKQHKTQLLPVLGSDILAPIAQPAAKAQPGGVLFCRNKGAEARGQRTANGFVVFQGSTAVLEERPSAEIYPYVVAQRKQLIADGTLIDKDGFLVFTKDAEFSSPSAAAAVIHGGSANGLTAWKTEGGKSLKQLDEQA
ncbi:MAG: DUF4357 domain-containing protein [Pseudomonadota bacterium]